MSEYQIVEDKELRHKEDASPLPYAIVKRCLCPLAWSQQTFQQLV